MPDVSIVIPNYNGISYLEGCLKSIQEQKNIHPEVMVVDNGSTDGSREFTEKQFPKEQFPGVKVLPLGENYGFPRAVNEGIRAASRPYVILLNNDTEVQPGFADALADCLEQHPEAFSAQAKLIQLHEPSKLDDAGNLYCALGWAFARGKDRSSELYEEPDEVFAACAGAAIYRKEVLDKIGYFDEAHFAYLEDIDLGWRARRAGWTNRYEPKAKVYHAGSGTSGSRYNEFKVEHSSKNNIYLIYKNMPTWQIALNLPLLIVGFGAKAAFFIKKGLGVTYLKGLVEGVRMCDKEYKVHTEKADWRQCLRIQWELWVNVIRRFSDMGEEE